MKRIQILCPVFREEEVILTFHERLVEATSALQGRYIVSFIYAMDPSPDATQEILFSLADRDPNVSVLVMSRRFGHQAALLAGLESCDCDALVMMDSDGQHPPELIPELVARWESGADIVQTIRVDGEETRYLKRTTSAAFYRLIGRIGSIDLKQGAADYRLLSRNVIDVLVEDFPERNVFLRGIIAWIGFNISYVEFQPSRRMLGASKYRASVLFNFAIQGISSFSKVPLRICTITGLLVSSLSVLLGIGLVVSYIAGPSSAPGWASIVLIMTFLGGIQLFFMGIFGEYLGQVFDEVKQRPRYLVASRRGFDSPAGNAMSGADENA